MFNSRRDYFACLANRLLVSKPLTINGKTYTKNSLISKDYHSQTLKLLFGDSYNTILKILAAHGVIERALGRQGYLTEEYAAKLNDLKLERGERADAYAKCKTLSLTGSMLSSGITTVKVSASQYERYFSKLSSVNAIDIITHTQALQGITISDSLSDSKLKELLEGKDDDKKQKIINAVNQIRKGKYNVKALPCHNREYSHFTTLPKSIRKKYLNANGKPLIEADISGCQIAALPWLFSKSNFSTILDSNTAKLINNVGSGLQYEVIIDKLSNSDIYVSHLETLPNKEEIRTELKKLHMRWMNSIGYQMADEVRDYDRFMKRDFPALHKFKRYTETQEYIDHFFNATVQRIGNMEPRNHYFHTFTIVEAGIIKEVVKRFVETGDTAMPIHDCIGVTEENVERAITEMKTVAKEKFNINIHVKRD